MISRNRSSGIIILCDIIMTSWMWYDVINVSIWEAILRTCLSKANITEVIHCLTLAQSECVLSRELSYTTTPHRRISMPDQCGTTVWPWRYNSSSIWQPRCIADSHMAGYWHQDQSRHIHATIRNDGISRLRVSPVFLIQRITCFCSRQGNWHETTSELL